MEPLKTLVQICRPIIGLANSLGFIN